MQKGYRLYFPCLSCEQQVHFSIFDLEKEGKAITCPHCQKRYSLEDETLKRQLKKFLDLCSQIAASEEILGNASVGIDVGNHQVKIPFKLLLTRLSSNLQLLIGDKPVSISFRIEPTKDLSAY